MSRPLWLALAAIVALLVGGLVVFWPFGEGKVLRLPGIVEIQEVRLGSKVGGRVKEVRVDEGDTVAAGQVLIEFEAPELENQWKQTKARLESAQADLRRAFNGAREEEISAAKAARDAAKARLDRVEYGWRDEEIKHARAELDSAQADYDQAVKEFARVTTLYREKSIARSEFDAALAYRDRAKGRKDAAEAKLSMSKSRREDKDEARAEWLKASAQYDLLYNGTRQEDKDAAEARVAELQAQLEAIEINLKETRIVVPEKLGKAAVEVIGVRPGDLVPPNQPVIRVLRVQDLWVKVFVPETQYGLLTDGKKVGVTIDTYPNKVLSGVVVQRANISEFTPRNVQSIDERRHQVFGVKIRVEDPQGVLNAGMAAQVHVPIE